MIHASAVGTAHVHDQQIVHSQFLNLFSEAVESATYHRTFEYYSTQLGHLSKATLQILLLYGYKVRRVPLRGSEHSKYVIYW